MKNLQTKKKVWISGLGILLGIVCLFFWFFQNQNQEEKEDFTADEMKLDQAVSQALLGDGEQTYLAGECSAEGHQIVGYEKKAEEIVVYAVTIYGEYGFENGHFVKISGSGVIPAVLYFDLSYQLKKIAYPQDGALYQESLQKLFPTEYYAKVIHLQNTAEESLTRDLVLQEIIWMRSEGKRILENMGIMNIFY